MASQGVDEAAWASCSSDSSWDCSSSASQPCAAGSALPASCTPHISCGRCLPAVFLCVLLRQLRLRVLQSCLQQAQGIIQPLDFHAPVPHQWDVPFLEAAMRDWPDQRLVSHVRYGARFEAELPLQLDSAAAASGSVLSGVSAKRLLEGAAVLCSRVTVCVSTVVLQP